MENSLSKHHSKRKFNARKFFRNILLALSVIAWTMVVYYLVQSILAVIVLDILKLLGLLDYSNLRNETKAIVGATLIYVMTLAITIFVPAMVKVKRVDLKQLGLQRVMSWSDLLYGPLGFIPYIIASTIITVLAIQFIPWFNHSQTQDLGLLSVGSGMNAFIAFVLLVFIAPFAEETLFRGYLYGKVKGYVGVVAATLFVSVCFGAVHGQWNVAIDVFALSVVLCGLREITGSIWAGIVLHMVKNTVAFMALYTYFF